MKTLFAAAASGLALILAVPSHAGGIDNGNVNLTDKGYEIIFKNGCYGRFNRDGLPRSFNEACNDLQISIANQHVKDYMRKYGATTEYSESRNATINKNSEGYEVMWKTDCFAQFTKHGKPMHFSDGCDENEIQKSQRIVDDYRRNN